MMHISIEGTDNIATVFEDGTIDIVTCSACQCGSVTLTIDEFEELVLKVREAYKATMDLEYNYGS